MKKYALLYFQQINDKFSKWLFPLHEGDNIIGSDKEVDLFLYLNEKEDIIDNVHCNIIVNEMQNDISIISLTSKGYVKRGEGDEKIILSPGKEYELNNKNVFYLTDNLKFMLIKGTIDEIHKLLLGENLEYEFQQWHQFIIANENNMKLNLNLTRKESYNKSYISNLSKNDNNNNNNNININTSLNNNHNLLNSAISNKNANISISNSILGSNHKEINRIGFNNFDEVPDDNLINDYKLFQQNQSNSTDNNNMINIKRNLIKTNSFRLMDNKISQNIINNKNNINNNDIINIDNNNNHNIQKDIEKPEIKNEIILNGDKNLDNKEKNENMKSIKPIDGYNNPLDLFRQASSEYKKNNNFNEKEVNKDEKTIQTIKELLGEINLDIICENTNYKDIKKYDVFFKKAKKNTTKKGV